LQGLKEIGGAVEELQDELSDGLSGMRDDLADATMDMSSESSGIFSVFDCCSALCARASQATAFLCWRLARISKLCLTLWCACASAKRSCHGGKRGCA
jgi:hypothetical protein